MTVDHLKKAIKKENQRTFETIELWKVSEIFPVWVDDI